MVNASSDGLNPMVFDYEFPDDKNALLLDAFDVLLGASAGLHLLHTEVKVVHSDISPRNIMYSWMNRCFKINDFNHAQPIELSLNTCRKSGTRGFVAPESLSSGIFSPQSNIFSLGQTLLWVFGWELGDLQYGKEEEVEHTQLLKIWQLLMKCMTSEVASLRPPLLLCIRIALFVVSLFRLRRRELIIKESKKILWAMKNLLKLIMLKNV